MTESDAPSRPLANAPVAPFWPRVGAWVIDAIVVVAAQVVLADLAFLVWESDWRGFGVAFLSAPILYRVIAHGRWGKTIGKRVTGICVRDARQLGRIGYGKALRREAAPVGLAIAPVLLLTGLLPIDDSLLHNEWFLLVRPMWLGGELLAVSINKDRRALHDFIGGTLVVAAVPGDMPMPPYPSGEAALPPTWSGPPPPPASAGW